LLTLLASLVASPVPIALFKQMTPSELKELQRKATTKFQYSVSAKIPKKKVCCVQFHVGRYGRNSARVFFPRAIDPQLAVKAAEDFLSEDLSVSLFETLKSSGDVFGGDTNFNDLSAFGEYPARSAALGDCYHLEAAIVRDGVLELECGS
jgi:hypothetical protein